MSGAETQITPPIVVAVLAGGKSRRMGRDKATIEVGGVSLLERVCRAASHAGLPVLVVGRDASSGSAAAQAQWRAVADDTPGSGPLGGLATALLHTNGSSVLLCAMDIPEIEPEAFRWLSRQAAAVDRQEWNGVVATWGGKLEPLFSVYHPSALPLVNQRMTGGLLSMRDLIEAGEFQLVELPKAHAGAVSDVDSPGDLCGLKIPVPEKWW